MPIFSERTWTSSVERVKTPGRRSLWWTMPMYAVVLGVLAFDLWTVWFWMHVGGSLG